jgi:hypothetical protein
MSNAAEVGNDSLDAVPFTLDLGLDTLHLVAVKRVGNILCYESVGHGGNSQLQMLTRRILRVAMIAVKLEEFLVIMQFESRPDKKSIATDGRCQ